MNQTFSKKILIVISLICFEVNICAQNLNDKFLFSTFNKIVKSDQSNIHKNIIRDSLILNNFDTINALLARGINLNSEQTLKKRTLKKLNTGLIITFIHVLQIDPSLLLNDGQVELYLKYLNENLLNIKQLQSALNIYKIDIEANRWPNWTDYYNQRIEVVRERLKMDSCENL